MMFTSGMSYPDLNYEFTNTLLFIVQGATCVHLSKA